MIRILVDWDGVCVESEAAKGLGWLTGAMLVSNYFFMKLAYLARPDMLLTLWLVGGWMATLAARSSTRARTVE